MKVLRYMSSWKTRIVVAITGVVVVLSYRCTIGAQARQGGLPAPQASEARSVWDGVFTEEQAARGKTIYSGECATCHGERLEGVDEAPSLAGQEFLRGWNGRTVGALFEQVQTKMPRDNPGQLSRSEYTDVVAYLLSKNRFPTGKSELPSEISSLRQIRLETAKPEPKK